MADYGVKIALPGKDISTAGLKDLILHSKYPLLKIVHSGGSSITFDYNQGTGYTNTFDVYTHDLDYEPRFFFWGQVFDTLSGTVYEEYYRMPLGARSSGGVLFFWHTPYVTTTKLRYYVDFSTSDLPSDEYTLYYYYIIYYDEE